MKYTEKTSNLDNSSFTGKIGVGKRDISPPAGIYSRNWGAAKRNTADGIHRALYLHAVTFSPLSGGEPFVLLSADLGWWKNMLDENFVRHHILEVLGLKIENLILSLTHTHSGPSLSRDDTDREGGDLIKSYLEFLRDAAVDLIRKTLAISEEGFLTWKYGKCDLAINRDLYDSLKDMYFVGYNPDSSADDTLLIGRITNKSGKMLAVIVNYACHPTTLAWENSLISPDFIGALRETIFSHTGADCIFLQGASGDLAPPEQYVGDASVADKHGRQLGYSCLSTLESMLPDERELSLKKLVESGAPLALWSQTEKIASPALEAKKVNVNFNLKPLQKLAEIEEELQACTDPVQIERLRRKRGVRLSVGDRDSVEVPLWVWKLGNSIIIAHPNEAYSIFQMEIRANFDKRPVAVINVANGHIGYLPPKYLYDKNIYAVWQTPFAAGSLEILINISINEAIELLR
ncbi:neutral/alkaline non-lysosomal ceramidase N-terminal domain-containing protein [Lunatibacter salilacus]|uniref:neutral/alkaline non-lysosomal ceramidase N-terminal domain-containing protein n=1 Tax=Lunatibacter salilacus TaxID=2483804 RepID=UPI00131A6547|nr:neutral/alkaline non-lysosomal ceramidase N-terminal domain-containing protein [Lunatibacter salilacus]